MRRQPGQTADEKDAPFRRLPDRRQDGKPASREEKGTITSWLNLTPMKRYYLDLRDGAALAPDEEGVELPDIEAVQQEAARALADMATEAVRDRRFNALGHCMAIEVRDDDGPVLQAKFSFEIDRRR